MIGAVNSSTQPLLSWVQDTAIASLGNTAVATIEKVTGVCNVGTELRANGHVSGEPECEGYDLRTVATAGLVGIAAGMLVGPYIVKKVLPYCTRVGNEQVNHSRALVLVSKNGSDSPKQGVQDDKYDPKNSLRASHYRTTIPTN